MYRDLARELETVEHEMVIHIEIGALGTVTKGMEKGRMETFKTTALLRSVRILRRVLDTKGDLLSLKLQTYWSGHLVIIPKMFICSKCTKSHLVIVHKKENLPNSGLCLFGWLERKIERKTEKAKKLESDGDSNCNWCAWYSHKRIDSGTGGLGNKRTSEDHPNYSIVEISQKTEKSPRDMRRLAVTQREVKSHQLTLV